MAFWLSVLVSLASFGTTLTSNEEIIRDVEGLRKSLTAKDGSRPALTLRLADLYFDEATLLSADPAPNRNAIEDLSSARQQAITLYQEALKGTPYHSGVTGDVAWKVKFQLARLFADQNAFEKATPLWKEIVSQKSQPRLAQEASLRLAEYYDGLGNTENADRAYKTALELCAGGDVCSYINYRRAWLQKNSGNLEAAIVSMKAALYDSKGKAREEALRDLIVFLAFQKEDGSETLPYVEELSRKLSRPTLLKELSDAFFAAGNRPAGVFVLNYVNTKTPTLDSQIRLIEEYYGLRDWENFRRLIGDVRRGPGPASREEKMEAARRNTLKRMLVQMEGERITKKEVAPDFQRLIEIYLNLIPETPDTVKLVESWCASEPSLEIQIDKLRDWETHPAYAALNITEKNRILALKKSAEIRFHRSRISQAQKSKDLDSIIFEAGLLSRLESSREAQRELKYVAARALYEKKDYVKALGHFQELARPPLTDNWAIQSQHLALDILGSEKKYSEVILQTDNWLSNEIIKKKASHNKGLSSELMAMKRIRDEARFQQAVAFGETLEALSQFEGFCHRGEFVPKSCANAKVLAVKLRKQKSLLSILQKTGAKEELASEYEAAGFFSEAARLLEEKGFKTLKNQNRTYLKVALLYELGGNLLERNRVLNNFIDVLSRKTALGEEAPLIFQTIKDAGLMSSRVYRLPWSLPLKHKLAGLLEDSGQGTPETKKDLMKSETSLGRVWSEQLITRLKILDEAQRNTPFYGARSQTKFELRLKRLKALTDEADRYFPGASIETQLEIATLLEKSHSDLAHTILTTPIPPEIIGSALEEVKGALTAMAQPFQEKAEAYAKLKVTPAPEPPVIADTKPRSPTPDIKAHLDTLHDNPSDRSALEGVKTYFEAKGQNRLSTYFQGRILQLEKKEEGT